MSTAVLILAAVAVGSIWAASALANASWPRRSPAAAILLWQALGLAWGLATVGALIGFGATAPGTAVASGALDRLAGIARAGGVPAAVDLVGAVRLVCLAAG
ncbi:MAG TPA: M56 family peptidase, partial [Streptosporangiaceae bacterium]|nr:M56 family peptidase [Streptosporangiaceae bacterium]